MPHPCLAFPTGVFEGVVRDQHASHCPSYKAEDEE
jgi:hypothetical protein